LDLNYQKLPKRKFLRKLSDKYLHKSNEKPEIK
jgi:hypothetical protein